MSWKFWEKDDDPLADLNDLSGGFSAPDPMGEDLLGQAQPPQPQFTPERHPQGMVFQPAEPHQTPHGDDKSVLIQELILARLDSIKNQLDVLNQRLSTLEQTRQQPKTERGPWYANR